MDATTTTDGTTSRCPRCDGTGRYRSWPTLPDRPCAVCNGTGLISDRPRTTCPTCQGYGTLLGAAPDRGNPVCDDCGGTGLKPETNP